MERPPPTLVHFLEGETQVEFVAQKLKDRDEALRQLKYNLQRAQEQMKYYADKKRKDVHFSIGDWVFLKLRPHKQNSVVQRIHQILAPRFFGPYKIVHKVGEVAYKLQLPENSRVHPVFHVSQLKKAIGNYQVAHELPLDLKAYLTNGIQPEKVLSWRDRFEEGQHFWEWLIQWQGMSAEDATWEKEVLLKSQFPELSLEDKAVFYGRGNDRMPNMLNMSNRAVGTEGEVLVGFKRDKPTIWRVYERKKEYAEG